MTEWKEYKLGDLIETNAKSIGKGYPYSKILYLDTGSITCNKIESLQECEIGEAPSRAKRMVRKEDIIYSSVRPDQLHYGFIKNPQDNLVVSTGFVTITCNKAILYPKFLYYYLIQSQITEYLHSVAEASTTAYPSLRPSDIEALDIEIPPIDEQKRIAGVLSSLDDKIDLLNRENTTLEALAETLFRHYFIENPDPTWKEMPVSYYGKVICGKTPAKKNAEYYGGEVPFVKIPDMHGKTYVFNSDDTLTKEGQTSQKEKTLPKESIMVSCIATVGLVSMNANEVQTNQQINSVVPYYEHYRYYLYCWFKSMYDELNTMASGGTATLNLNTGDFSRIGIPMPDEAKIKEFHLLVEPLFAKTKSNQQQMQTLAIQRDTLLPRLMSSEVKVNNKLHINALV